VHPAVSPTHLKRSPNDEQSLSALHNVYGAQPEQEPLLGSSTLGFPVSVMLQNKSLSHGIGGNPRVPVVEHVEPSLRVWQTSLPLTSNQEAEHEPQKSAMQVMLERPRQDEGTNWQGFIKQLTSGMQFPELSRGQPPTQGASSCSVQIPESGMLASGLPGSTILQYKPSSQEAGENLPKRVVEQFPPSEIASWHTWVTLLTKNPLLHPPQ